MRIYVISALTQNTLHQTITSKKKMKPEKAIILLSGGLDSTTCLAIAKASGFECIALSFNYGQKHSSELEASKKIAKHFGVPHHIIECPCYWCVWKVITNR